MNTQKTSLVWTLLLCIIFTTHITKLYAPPPLCKSFTSETQARNFLYNVAYKPGFDRRSKDPLLMFRTLDYETAQILFYVVSVSTERHIKSCPVNKSTLFVTKKKARPGDKEESYFFVKKYPDGTYKDPFRIRAPFVKKILNGLVPASSLTKIYEEFLAIEDTESQESADRVRLHVIPTEEDAIRNILIALASYQEFIQKHVDKEPAADFLDLQKAIRKLINTRKTPAETPGMLVIERRDIICAEINNALARTRVLDGQTKIVYLLQEAIEKMLILGGMKETPWTSTWNKIITKSNATKIHDKRNLATTVSDTFETLHDTLQRLNDDDPRKIILDSIKRICEEIYSVTPESPAEKIQNLVEQLDEIISKYSGSRTTDRILTKAILLLNHWQPDVARYVRRHKTGSLNFKDVGITPRPRTFSDARLQRGNDSAYLRPSTLFYPKLKRIAEEPKKRGQARKTSTPRSARSTTRSASPRPVLTSTTPSTPRPPESSRRPIRSLTPRPAARSSIETLSYATLDPIVITPQPHQDHRHLDLEIGGSQVSISPEMFAHIATAAPGPSVAAATGNTREDRDDFEQPPRTPLRTGHLRHMQSIRRSTGSGSRSGSETESGSSTSATSSGEEGRRDRPEPRSALPRSGSGPIRAIHFNNEDVPRTNPKDKPTWKPSGAAPRPFAE